MNNSIKSRLQEVIRETLQGVVSEDPEIKVTCANDELTDDEKLVNEIMEENLDGVFHVETTLRLVEPIEHITINLSLNE